MELYENYGGSDGIKEICFEGTTWVCKESCMVENMGLQEVDRNQIKGQ